MLEKTFAACISATAFVALPALAQSAPPSAAAAAASFATGLHADQMMASGLIGTTIVSTNREAVGDVNDVVLDRSGRTVALVVGVGGFLGIGEKAVAVPFEALDFNARPHQATLGIPAATGSTPAAGGTGPSTTAAAKDGVPRPIILKMTKAELQAAPAFRASNASGASSSPGSNR